MKNKIAFFTAFQVQVVRGLQIFWMQSSKAHFAQHLEFAMQYWQPFSIPLLCSYKPGTISIPHSRRN